MTIELGDGLQADEVIEICKRFDIKRLLSPQLLGQLNGGINALMMVQDVLNKVPPMFLGFLPLPPGWQEQLNNAVVLARIAKAVIE